jgi:hypothetical protein
MGYYTAFKITTNSEQPRILELLAFRLSEISEHLFEIRELALKTSEAIKWYEYHKHLKKISSEPTFKDLIITVEGEGEKSGDIWKEIYKNGENKRVEAVITFPDLSFD